MKTVIMMTVALGCAFGALADVSFAYQGALADATGEPYSNKTVNVTIKLYDRVDGGTCLWATKANAVTSTDGTFNVEVADATGGEVDEVSYPPLKEVMASRSEFYLGLTVGETTGEIVPRQKIIPVPQSLFAHDVKEASGDFSVKGCATFHGGIRFTAVEGAAQMCKLENGEVQANSLIVGSAQTDALKVTRDLAVSQDVSVDRNLAVGGNLSVAGTTLSAEQAAMTVNSLAVASPSFTVNGMTVAIPIGVIVMWYGAENAVPAGWAICNGQTVNGVTTPNLTGRFVVGAGADSTYKASDGGDAYQPGAKGGERTHKLSTQEMPSHTHSITMHTGDLAASWKDQRNFYLPWAKYPGTSTETSTSAGGNAAHENRPPYYALYYIMKVK